MATDRSLNAKPGHYHLTGSDATIRLSLDVSPELSDALTQLASKLHTSKSDVLRKAIALMEVAVRAKEQHKKFGIAAPDQALETEIVGL
jgi:predicted transcriptional regulator